MRCVRLDGGRKLSFSIFVLALFALGLSSPDITAQGSATDIGNGGRHTIQGRIYISNGRRSQISGLKIRLTSALAADISIISDESGTFAFRGLGAGSYTVMIEGGTQFEDHTENVMIDDPGTSNIRTGVRMGSVPRIMNVQVYLRPKPTTENTKSPSVINAKWAAVPKGAIDAFERGVKLVQEGNDREAEALFKQSIEISPSFAPAHTALGRIAQRAGNLSGAIECWKTAIRYDAEDFDANLNLGIAYLNLKRYPEAESALVTAAYLEPSAVTPHYYIGIAYVMRNDLDVAAKAFEKAKELNGGKTLPAIHKYLGRIYGARNRPKDAIHELETYLKLMPNAPDAEKVRKDISDIKSRSN